MKEILWVFWFFIWVGGKGRNLFMVETCCKMFSRKG